jgi:hypothetical protein
MKVLVLNNIKGIRAGEVVICRELHGPFGILTGYQCIEGHHIGKTFLPIEGMPEIEVVEPSESKKVELPKEVADVIDDFKKDGRDVDYIARYLTCYSCENSLTKRIRILREYAQENGFSLLAALANGYTVEEEPTVEEKIKDRVIQVLKTASMQPALEPFEERHARVAEKITLAVREVLAEHRQDE